jgi:hypothetical protein
VYLSTLRICYHLLANTLQEQFVQSFFGLETERNNKPISIAAFFLRKDINQEMRRSAGQHIIIMMIMPPAVVI